MDKRLAALQGINAVLTGLSPAIGTIIALGEEIVADIRSGGQNIGTFADEIGKFDAIVSDGVAADAAWRFRHGLKPREDAVTPDPIPVPEPVVEPVVPPVEPTPEPVVEPVIDPPPAA